jgi:hypothetical protein
MGVGKIRKENINVLMENQLLKTTEEKMIIFLTQLLSKNFRQIQGNICFFFNFIQIFVDVVMLCSRPNINFKLT